MVLSEEAKEITFEGFLLEGKVLGKGCRGELAKF